jgi:hypothetical protein
MNKVMVVIIMFSLSAMPALAAQLYRWVDDAGRVEWRDTPPPPTAKKVEQRNIGVSTIQTSEQPYSVQLAVKNFPVTLWANNCGEGCDKARALLSRRGVPYAEKDPRADFEAFKKVAGGDLGIPLLFVGSTKLRGYLESDWNDALDIAGYPKTALNPVRPAATPAADNTPAPPTATPAPTGYPALAQ